MEDAGGEEEKHLKFPVKSFQKFLDRSDSRQTHTSKGIFARTYIIRYPFIFFQVRTTS